jgi:para-aminobenzoate synthetase/4-amino-4-deoxychorismate lyase
VRATLKQGVDTAELLRGIFPPGSIVGAPKIHAMELIRRFETEPRGVYCGAIGYISPKGHSLFNVAIRTAVIFRNADGEMGIGSGVVFDSQGPKEYAECLLKMKFLTDPVKRFELIETLLFDQDAGGFVLLERHIERLATSARYFAYVYDEDAVRGALQDAVAAKSGRLRVRLLLAEGGQVTVTTTPLPPAEPNAVMRFAVSSSRVDSSDLFLFHKTTRRELYDREWQEYADRLGTDEVIYLNERGELAEGSRTTIFIARDGKLLTPHLGSGLLPGTLRAELIAEGKAQEAVLTLADLQSADKVFLGNSVRGLVPATRIDVVR